MDSTDRHPLLILEILESVFRHLNEFELIVCSSVSLVWYDAVAHVFQLWNQSKRLYAWPHGSIPERASDLCIVGLQELDLVLNTCRGISRLHLSSTEPTIIRRGLVTNVLAKCPALKELCFSNLKFDKDQAEELLTTVNDFNLAIMSLEKGATLDPPTLRLLLDNRELFSGILLMNGRRKNAIGWYPNPIDPVYFIQPSNIKRLSLDCFGLSGCHLTRSLVVLSLKNASGLGENSLSLIARLPLKRFQISFLKASEKRWIDVLNEGFTQLISLSVVDCDNWTESVFNALASRKLVDLDVDTRMSASESGAVRFLSQMTSLKRLRLNCADIIVRDATQLLVTELSQLRTLTVIKYNSSFISPADFMFTKNFKQVKIKYKLVNTKTNYLLK